MATSTRRFASIIPIVAAALLLHPAAAAACSCVPPDIDRDLPAADAAVVGTLGESSPVDDRPGHAAETMVDVEHVAKGVVDLDEIRIRHAGSSAACGLDMPAGQRVGMLLTRDDDGGWSSSLCQLVDPDELSGIRLGPEPELGPPKVEERPAASLLARLVELLRTLCATSLAG